MPEKPSDSEQLPAGVFIDIQPAGRLNDLPRLNSYTANIESEHLTVSRGIALVFDADLNLFAIGAFHKGKGRAHGRRATR